MAEEEPKRPLTTRWGVPAHEQRETHRYAVHFPDHPARQDDPHYKDFDHYHKATRSTARCLVGLSIGWSDCRDASGSPVAPDGQGFMAGLELHHSHIEFALQNGVDLAALEKAYPGISNPEQVGAWVESAANLVWLCCFHHRGPGGAHTASASDFEAEKFVRGLISE